MKYKLGAHVSISSGYEHALEKIVEMGGNCLQMFSSSPRRWHIASTKNIDPSGFIRKKTTLKVDPIYFHASYLINLADEEKIGSLSKTTLINELQTASRLGIKGSIVHLGSFKKNKSELRYKILLRHMSEVLEKMPSSVLFIIENAGNRKIGSTFDEIGTIVKTLADPRIRVCLDTCHLHSTGHDLATPKKLEIILDLFEKQIGLKKLELWHINDSHDSFASFRDRHANIGTGTIAMDEFRYILTHPQLRGLPFIIETPGFDGKGPDKKNLDILKKLI